MRLRKFNANRESRKLSNRQRREYQVKTRTMILSIGILICSIILCTYAAFKTSGKVDVMKSSVGNLVQDDYTINAFIEGVASNTVPDVDDGYVVDHITCTNGATGTWDDTNWGILITGAEEPTTCNIYFVEPPQPSEPELYNRTTGKAGLIPVKYGTNGVTIVADPDNEDNDWYNYDEHIWANAVLVSNYGDYYDSDGDLIESTIGTTITSSNILQYYVWIPRYRYKLFNAVAGESTPEQMIEIEFEKITTTKSNGTSNGEWLTHPAFTFGSTELNGIWVGKFEPAYAGSGKGQANGTGFSSSLFSCSNESCSSASNIRIIPNVNAIKNVTISNSFYITRSIESNSTFNIDSNQLDTHMMKNMEWGAVAYLTSSIYGRYTSSSTCTDGGCEVWNNGYRTGSYPYTYKTGCAGASVSAGGGAACNQWYTTNGVHASTTDNVYGIYDMSSGLEEYVMANQSSSTTVYIWNVASSEFSSAPDSKYYDKYLKSTGSSNNNQKIDQARGLLGDATRETMKTYGSTAGAWFSDSSSFFYSYSDSYCWLGRGNFTSNSTGAGIFSYISYSGTNQNATTFRIVMTAEDE